MEISQGSPRRKAIVIVVLVVLGISLAGGLAHWLLGNVALRRAGSSEAEQRLQAIEELRGNPSRRASRALRRLIDDPDQRVAVRAVRALGHAQTELNRKYLHEVIREPRAGAVRGEAAAALGVFEQTDPRVLTEMLASDEQSEARAGAAKGLSRMGKAARPVIPDLLEALDDRDQEVRVWASTALNKACGGVRFNYSAEAPRAKRLEQIAAIRRILKRYGML